MRLNIYPSTAPCPIHTDTMLSVGGWLEKDDPPLFEDFDQMFWICPLGHIECATWKESLERRWINRMGIA